MSNENPADKESIGTNVELSKEQLVQLSREKPELFVEVRSDDENPDLEDIWFVGQPITEYVDDGDEQ
jgi:hypothetical protein